MDDGIMMWYAQVGAQEEQEAADALAWFDKQWEMIKNEDMSAMRIDKAGAGDEIGQAQ